MQGLVFVGDGSVGLRSLPIRQPSASEVLLRVEAVGLCGSDLAAIGPARSIETSTGAVLGHEVSGAVVEGGPGATDLEGRRVVVHPNVSCGVCRSCAGGRPNLCPTQYTLGMHRDGGAAEYLLAPRAQVHAIPDGLDGVIAALAEPLACVLNGVDKAGPRAGEAAVVLGAGPIGLLFCAVLADLGIRPVLVSEPSAYRAGLARSLGADEVVDPRTGDLREAVETLTDGRGAEIVVDCVGGQLAQALDVVAPAGRVVLFGAHPGEIRIDALRVLYREISIAGVFTALHTFPRAVRFLDQHAAQLALLVTHRFPLERYEEAIDLLREGSAGKVVLLPGRPAARTR